MTTLKTAKLLPFEYVILEKEEYVEPIRGTGEYGDWQKYSVRVIEYVTVDENTGDKITRKDVNEVVSYFASKGIDKQIKDLPLNVKFKITMEQKDNGKGKFSVYNVEVLDNVAADVKPTAANVEVSMDEKISLLIKAGVDDDGIAKTIVADFETTEEFVKKRIAALR